MQETSIGGKAAVVTPTRPITTESSITSPIMGGHLHRSPASERSASPSPLKILQQTCNDVLRYEATCDSTPRRQTNPDGNVVQNLIVQVILN
jgi:hypothetical protein